MTRVLITLPLPPIELKANRTMGQKWKSSYSVKTAYGLEAWQELLRQRPWPVTTVWPVHLYVMVYVGKGMQLPDLSDAGTWCKVACDLMVHAGIFPDDGPKYIKPFTADADRDWKRPRVEFSWETGE